MTAPASLPAGPAALHPGASVEAIPATGGEPRRGGRFTAGLRVLRSGMATVRVGTVLAQGEIIRCDDGRCAVRDGARIWTGEMVT